MVNGHDGIKIILADSRTLLRQSLRFLLENQSNINMVGEARDGFVALQLTHDLSPDLVLIDSSLPGIDCIDIIRQISNNSSHAKFLVLASSIDRNLILEALKAGAAGYMSLDCDLEEIVKAINYIMLNRIYLSPSISEALISSHFHNVDKRNLSLSLNLTNRETEILQFLADGKTAKEISVYLQLSIKTVETHRQNIMEKLNIHSLAGLVKYAIREGLSKL